MRVYIESLNDWRSRLARLEVEIALCESAGEINWHLRIKARVLRFLLARYGGMEWRPPDPLRIEGLSPAVVARGAEGEGVFAGDEDAGATARAAAGVRGGVGGVPELTWYEVCFCLLPWDGPWASPGNEKFETPPRSREVIADRLRTIHELNTAPRRRWFKWW